MRASDPDSARRSACPRVGTGAARASCADAVGEASGEWTGGSDAWAVGGDLSGERERRRMLSGPESALRSAPCSSAGGDSVSVISGGSGAGK